MILMPNTEFPADDCEIPLGDRPERVVPRATYSKEKVLQEAVEIAREALADLTRPSDVGTHLGVIPEGERTLTHAFECLRPGYRGWMWVVTLARASRSRDVTINEMALVPGTDALMAPAWVPWADRLQPSDVGPTDRLPYRSDDPRLQQNFEETDDVDIDSPTFELGLGRERVLSESGRASAFHRWYHSDAGPKNQATRVAGAQCSTCGFLMLMAGSARQLFGVCANEWSPFDGRVVSLDHGCGAHSETDEPQRRKMWNPSKPVVNESDVYAHAGPIGDLGPNLITD